MKDFIVKNYFNLLKFQTFLLAIPNPVTFTKNKMTTKHY